MKGSLSDLWSSWVEQYAARQTRTSKTGAQGDFHCLSALPLGFVSRTIAEPGASLSFVGPSRRTCLEALERDLEPIGTSVCPVTKMNGKRVTQMHVLNMFWQPLLQYIDALADGAPASWTSGLAEN